MCAPFCEVSFLRFGGLVGAGAHLSSHMPRMQRIGDVIHVSELMGQRAATAMGIGWGEQLGGLVRADASSRRCMRAWCRCGASVILFDAVGVAPMYPLVAALYERQFSTRYPSIRLAA